MRNCHNLHLKTDHKEVTRHHRSCSRLNNPSLHYKHRLQHRPSTSRSRENAIPTTFYLIASNLPPQIGREQKPQPKKRRQQPPSNFIMSHHQAFPSLLSSQASVRPRFPEQPIPFNSACECGVRCRFGLRVVPRERYYRTCSAVFGPVS
jgi:hypothetical protein